MGFGFDLVAILKLNSFFSEKTSLNYIVMRFALNLFASFLAVASFLGTKALALSETQDETDVSSGTAIQDPSVDHQGGGPVVLVVRNLDARISRLSSASGITY